MTEKMVKENLELGWAVIQLLNYDVAYSIPRSFHEDFLLKELGKVKLGTPKHLIYRSLTSYFENKQGSPDLKLFQKEFGFEMNPSWKDKLELNYQNGLPNKTLTESMASELFHLFLPIAENNRAAHFWTKDFVYSVLKDLFGYYTPHSSLIYTLDDLITKIISKCLAQNISSFSHFEMELNNCNPLPKKKGRPLTQEEYELFFEKDKECREAFRAIIKKSA